MVTNVFMPFKVDKSALGLSRASHPKTKLPGQRLLIINLNLPRLSGIRSLRSGQQLRRLILFLLTTSKREEDKIAAYNLLNVAVYISLATVGEDFQISSNLLDCDSRCDWKSICNKNSTS